MTTAISKFFVTIFGGKSWLATTMISMIPLFELKGGIPFGMSTAFWGENALNLWASFGFALLGSCLVVPILALVFKPIISWLKKTKLFKKLALALEQRIQNKSAKIKSETEEVDASSEDEQVKNRKAWLKKFFGVMAFVCVPLPLTGVWMGTCIGLYLGLNFWHTCLSVISGNIIAGLLILACCAILGPNKVNYLTYAMLIIIAILLLFFIVKAIIKAIKKKKSEKNCQ